MKKPRAGLHYPRSVGEVQAWFRTDADCLALRGSVNAGHLPSYHDEFVFRFNRHSRSRVMLFCRVLELAVAHEPVRYRDLIINPQTRENPPTAPIGRGHPPSLDRDPANRPWRRADQHSSG